MLKDKKGKQSFSEAIFRTAGFIASLITVATTATILYIILWETYLFFREVPVWDFLFGTRWAPLLEPRSFGVLPLICGSLMIVVGASLVAIPLGLATAVFLSEFAGQKTRSILKPVLEVLAGIPTIVYGYFALVILTPALRHLFPTIQVFNALSASIVVGIMVLPMVATLCEDALQNVPLSLKRNAYALGATPFEVIKDVVIPTASSGIIASFILAVSRALGETMAVTLAAGATPKLTINPLESIQTVTAYIVQVSLGDTPAGTIEYKSIFAVSFILFMITYLFNIIGIRFLKKRAFLYEG
ncbi:MAG: phosphate ABC transporter permease subunit PstC [Candidatus Dadabacteria bacterium]|nr:MAG: phosphate ABC transporter permease subunit PstC [Candidatus Dadabacteria bacterium]